MSNANRVDCGQLTSAMPNASDVVCMFTVPLSPVTDVVDLVATAAEIVAIDAVSRRQKCKCAISVKGKM
jgi:hypothetical protein